MTPLSSTEQILIVILIPLFTVALLLLIYNLITYNKDSLEIAKRIISRKPKDVIIKNLTGKPILVASYYKFLKIYTGLTKQDAIKYSLLLKTVDLTDETFWIGFDVQLDAGINYLDLENIYHQVIFLFLYNHKLKDKLYEIEIKY